MKIEFAKNACKNTSTCARWGTDGMKGTYLAKASKTVQCARAELAEMDGYRSFYGTRLTCMHAHELYEDKL